MALGRRIERKEKIKTARVADRIAALTKLIGYVRFFHGVSKSPAKIWSVSYAPRSKEIMVSGTIVKEKGDGGS